ncbi:MAG: NADH oxidase [Flavobacteriales bacterium]|nr:MAG: NADH oxidase [Flavobacteriales bacterium]
MIEITVQELKQKMDSKEDFQLIDVRESYEYDIANIGGELIPMAEIMSNIDKISKEKEVVVHCRSGKRSAAVCDALEREFGITNLHNLKGGILAWVDEIDNSLAKY